MPFVSSPKQFCGAMESDACSRPCCFQDQDDPGVEITATSMQLLSEILSSRLSSDRLPGQLIDVNASQEEKLLPL